MAETRTYFAVSLFSSRTAWFAAGTVLVGILALPDVLALIPARFMPGVLALVGVVNLLLRWGTVRPALLIAPGTTAPVEVPILGPPPPPTVSD